MMARCFPTALVDDPYRGLNGGMEAWEAEKLPQDPAVPAIAASSDASKRANTAHVQASLDKLAARYKKIG